MQVKKSITQLRKERDQAAIRAARYRAERASRPDVRAVDKALSEAVSIYSRTLPAEAAIAFLAAMVDLASDGLVFRGYGPKSSRKRTALRLAGWVSPTPTSGSVRAAVDRKAVAAAAGERDGITAS